MLTDLISRLTSVVRDWLHGAARTPALSDLDRAVASAGASHLTARRALAIALAEERRETERRAAAEGRIADLETRAVEALRGGREDLAMEAAAAIAALRTDVEASREASRRFAAEAEAARREVDGQHRRLAALDRGRRIARVGAALNATAPGRPDGLDRLAVAEMTLADIETANADAKAVREELAPPGERLADRMAREGFGPRLTIEAAEVMRELRARLGAGTTAAPILIAKTSETPT